MKMMFIVYSRAADLSLIHISEPTRLLSISYAVFCLKKKILTHIFLFPSSFSFVISTIIITYSFLITVVQPP